MTNAALTPCSNWVERLAIRNHDDLSYADCMALNEHLALCSACATAHAAYQLLGYRIGSLSAVTPLESLPLALLQQPERSVSRIEQALTIFSRALMWLQSLFVTFTMFFQRVHYRSDNRYCYALRNNSDFLLWKYKKSETFFSAPGMKNGVAYTTLFDSTLFLFAARVRPCSDSFLWKV
jgi:hypothetical protein